MNILIVESRAKCKTLLKHLGKNNWRVLPTGGHVERLPEDPKLHPKKEVKKAYWSNSPGQIPQPPWFWTERGEAAIAAIKKEAGKHDAVTLYLATDPDREGERIAWQLEKLLSEIGPCHRVAFQEITKQAVLAAIEEPREVNQPLVEAALIRLFIDRHVGWRASNIAKLFTTALSNSMGRVQTPTLGFIVERELEREAHVPVRFFEVTARTLVTDFRVRFHEKSDSGAWVDGKNRFSAHRTGVATLASSAHVALAASGRISISKASRQEKSQPPRPPFSTDALLQAAGSRWGWSPQKTSVLAGMLYEQGHITYIRTDSTRLAAEAVEAGRSLIAETWGRDMLGTGTQTEPAAGIQDAHEAIRPTQFDDETVSVDDPDAQKLYALVRSHTLAALMIPSVRVTLSLKSKCEKLANVLEGSVGWYAQPGWRSAFESVDPDYTASTTPIAVDVGTQFDLVPDSSEQSNPELREDETKPPARYSAHGLVKAMKDEGIGRPSTYASTVTRLEDRKYITIDGGALAPTQNGRNVWLEAAPLFTLDEKREVFKTDYTAELEAQLDQVAEGKATASVVWKSMRDEFRAAHMAAQQATKTGSILPSTREKLRGFLEAAPQYVKKVGDLDSLTEKKAKELLDWLKTKGIVLLPTQTQQSFLESLLVTTGFRLTAAVEGAGLKMRGDRPNREEAKVLIEYLLTLPKDGQPPSDKQLKFIKDLAKKSGLDEAGACALVGLTSYEELTGGKHGTASSLITALKGTCG